MSISVSSGTISYENSVINNKKKILIAGKCKSNIKAREILNPSTKEEALALYGEGDLYDSFEILFDMNVENIYTVNCFSDSDYIRLMDKLLHYDFDYFVPINIYLSDKFYNPIIDSNEYFAAYFLNQLSTVENLMTIIMTERHASLYEDFDSYTIAMNKIETDFMNSYSASDLLNQQGNNLNFVYNNLKDVAFSNVVLGALLCNRNYGEYLSPLTNIKPIFDIDNNDMYGLRAMYFKYNYFALNTTVENTLNFKTSNDIYSNALIDDLIKQIVKEVNLSAYKGKLYNPYISMQIETELRNKLNSLRGKLFRRFNVEKISFKKTDKTSGHIIANYNIQPYGTLENLNIVMGVI